MKNRKRFTMIEMVVVVLLIALLAAIATPMYFGYLKDARVTAAKSQLDLFQQAITDYSLKMGSIPSQEAGLDVLVKRPADAKGWRPFLKGDSSPLDPWGKPYIYRVIGSNEYELISYGEDGKAGGEEYDEDLILHVNN